MKYNTEMRFPPDYEEHAQYMAKNLKDIGVDITVISQGTGLSVEEVEVVEVL